MNPSASGSGLLPASVLRVAGGTARSHFGFSGLVVLAELALVVEELGQRGSSRIVVELASGLVMALRMYAA